MMRSTRSRNSKTSTPCCTQFMKNRTAEEVEIGGQGPEAREIQPPARGWWRGVRWLLAFYLVLLLAMTFLETWLVYPIPPADPRDWHPAGLEFEDVLLAA